MKYVTEKQHLRGRPAERIAPLLARLERVWRKHPDVRLGQLLMWAAAEGNLHGMECEQIVARLERITGGGT